MLEVIINNFHILLSSLTISVSRFALSLFVVFGTTLSVFPSVIVLITSQYRCDNMISWGQGFIILFEYTMMNTRTQSRSEPDNVWASTYFTPVSCFLLFNCGDYVGRILAGWVRWPGKVRRGNLLSLTYHRTKRRSKKYFSSLCCRERADRT